MELEDERKSLKRQQILLQMKKDIVNLEYQIKNANLVNFKINTIKNLKISVRALQLLAPYVLTGGILVGGFALVGNIPFYPYDEWEIAADVKMEFDNLGNIRYEKQYTDFANANNILSFSSKWELQEDGFYKRLVKTYGIRGKNYEELIELFSKQDLVLEDILGEAITTVTETKNNLTAEEINADAFMQAVIYYEDKNECIIHRETISENALTSLLYVLLNVIIDCEIFKFRYKHSKFDFKKCVDKIEKDYQPLDVEELTRRLEIRRDNYQRITKRRGEV